MTAAPDSVLDVVREHARRDHAARIGRVAGPYASANLLPIARDPLLHPDTARALLDLPDVRADVRAAVAGNSHCPLDATTLDQLARDEAPAVLNAAQCNPRTPFDVVHAAVADTGRGNVLLSPQCPPDLLSRAATGKDTNSHRLAARNPALPARDRNRLSRSSSEEVRRALLTNPALTQSDFANLAPRGMRPRRANRAGRYGGTWERPETMFVAWAAHPGADPQWLASRYRTGSTVLKATIAGNPATPAATLQAAFEDNYLAGLDNPGMPADVARTAVATITGTHKDTLAARTLAANGATPADVLAQLRLRTVLTGNDQHPNDYNDLLHGIVLAHARNGAQAMVALAVVDGWDWRTMPDQSIWDLLEAASTAGAPAA